MSSWIQRVGALFGSRAPLRPVATRPAPARARPRETSAAAMPPVVGASTAEAPPVADPQAPFFEWLLDLRPTLEVPLLPHEHRLLARLDRLITADSAGAELLPRAPAVIPQLMNSLRDTAQSAHALADRIAKDPNLVAEVIRLANSALMRAAEPVGDLPEAVQRLGTIGVRRAIAKVVLKPIFDAPPDSFSGRAAPKLWLHSEAQADECMRLATAAGLDPFEGYLAGLMHDIGWTASLRALDKVGGSKQPTEFSLAFVQAFEARRDKFFAMLVIPWQLTDSLTALAAELQENGLAAARSELAQALRAADRHACTQVLADSALLESTAVQKRRA